MKLPIRRTVMRFVALAIPTFFAGVAHAAEPPGDSFWAQKESVSAVAFTADGKTLVTAGGGLGGGHVAFWDVGALTRTRHLTKTGMVNGMLVAPDGKTLVVYATEHLGGRLTRSTVRVLDAATGKAIAEVESPAELLGPTNSMALSADGRALAVGHAGGAVTLHDPKTGKVTATLAGGKQAVWKVAFSPDGKTLAAGGAEVGVVRLWDIAGDKALASVPTGRDSAAALAFSPDGKTLVVGTGRDHDTPGELVVWDLPAEKVTGRWKGHAGPVVSVHYSRDGKHIASGARSSDIRLWDAATGKVLLALSGPLNLSGVAFAPDGKTLAVAGGTGDFVISIGGVRLWDMPSGRERLPPKAAAERDRCEAAHKLTAAEQLKARAARDRDPAHATDRTRRAEYALHIHLAQEHVARWEFKRARDLLDELRPAAGRDDLRGLEWHLLDARLPKVVELGDSEPAHHAALSPDGKLVALAGGRNLRVLDAATGKPLFTGKGFRHHAGAVTFSPDGALVAVADYTPNADTSDVKVFAVPGGKEVVTLTGHRDGVETLAFSSDGKQLASGGRGSRVIVWDAATWKPAHTFDGERSVGQVAFSPDGKRLVLSEWFGHFRVRDLKSGKDVFAPADEHRGLGDKGVVFLPGGERLLAADRDGIAVVEAATGRVVRWLRGSGAPTLTPDGHSALVGWSLLNIESGKELARFEDDVFPGRRPRHGYEPLARCVTADGRVMVVVADEDHTWLAAFPLGDGRRELTIGADSLDDLGFARDGSALLARTSRNLHQPGEDGPIVGHAPLVERWDAATGEVRFRARWFDLPGLGLTFDPKGGPRVTTGRANPTLAELAAVRAPVNLNGAEEAVGLRGLSPDGVVLALYEGENELTFRDARTGAVRSRVKVGESGWDVNVLFTSDGGALTWKDELVLWDTKTGGERARWALPGRATAVQLTADGTRPAAAVLITAKDPGLVLWDVRLGERVAVLRGAAGWPGTAAFSPDGRTLATGSGDGVRLWDAISGHPRGVLRGHREWVGQLVFRPDGKALAAGSYREGISLWAVPGKGAPPETGDSNRDRR